MLHILTESAVKGVFIRLVHVAILHEIIVIWDVNLRLVLLFVVFPSLLDELCGRLRDFVEEMLTNFLLEVFPSLQIVVVVLIVVAYQARAQHFLIKIC
jgi:hypothetical protein